MKSPAYRIGAIALTTALQTALINAAHAESTDCFPLCATQNVEDAAPAEPANTQLNEEQRTAACRNPLGGLSDNALVHKAESLNARVKPVKEIVGYIRSPQGLAVKLVNDHIVRIPAWVGYAADPVGSLKSRAMSEAKSRARALVSPDAGCKAEPGFNPDDSDKHSL
jgi:hypothetical protein